MPTDPNLLLESFNLMDADGDNNVTISEMRDILCNFGERMTENEIVKVMALFDSDGNGNIDYNEFCEMVVNLCENCRTHDQINSTHYEAPVDPELARKSRPVIKTAKAVGGKQKPPRSPQVKAPPKPAVMEPVYIGNSDPAPENVQVDWDIDRMHGTFQADLDGFVQAPSYLVELTESTEIYLQLTLQGSTSRSNQTPIDAGFYVTKEIKGANDVAEIVGYVAPQMGQAASVRLSLDAGRYMVLPVSSGTNLKVRTAQPAQKSDICEKRNGETVLTEKGLKTIKDIFNRFDLDMRGTLGRSEYDLLNVLTSGETTNEDIWGTITQMFESEGSGSFMELTLKGFTDLWSNMLIEIYDDDECTDEDLFEDLAKLGYNENLDLDEAQNFVLFFFAKRHNTMARIEARPPNEELSKQVMLLLTLTHGVWKPSDNNIDVVELWSRTSCITAVLNKVCFLSPVSVSLSSSPITLLESVCAPKVFLEQSTFRLHWCHYGVCTWSLRGYMPLEPAPARTCVTLWPRPCAPPCDLVRVPRPCAPPAAEQC